MPASPPHLHHVAGSPSFDRVEEWTVSQAADMLGRASLSPSTPSRFLARDSSARTVTIDIPLDTNEVLIPSSPPPPQHRSSRPSEAVHTVHRRTEPIRRDSLKRREALAKGKEGSRRRQRWENDRLLSNPYAEPPLPSDWEVRPTYPVHRNGVPYFLAPLWDAEYARKQRERERRRDRARAPESKEEAVAAEVTRQLRAKMKKSRAAKGLLQDLEEEVRGFVKKWEEKQAQLEDEGIIEPDSSDDEEIVFVGRNGAMSDDKKSRKENETLEKDKLIFQSLLDDHGASFGRYLVHSIATYYDLKTWSVTTGNLREAYVGLKIDPKTRRPSLTKTEMPKPLYALV